MGVFTHPGGGTAHEDQNHASALTPTRTLFCGLLTRVSHTGFVEASPRSAACQKMFVPLEHAALGAGSAPDDMVLWRFPTRTFRDRQSFLRRLPAQASPTGTNGPGLSESIGQDADGCVAGHRHRRSPDTGVAAGGVLVGRRFHRYGLRWLTGGMSAYGGIGSTAGPGRQRRLGTDNLDNRLGASATGIAVGLAHRQRHGQ